MQYAMSQIPEQYLKSQSAAVQTYVAGKYSKYGYRKQKSIEYNREFKPKYTSDRYRWVENVSRGLRFVGKADDVIRLDHTGYYTDNFQNETVHGEVWQLPARGGVVQYVPAVNDPCNDDCSCVDFSFLTDSKEDAAHWADSMAEMWAESEREYQAKEDAKNRLEEIEREVKETYADFRRVAREIRANCDVLRDVAVVRELVRDKWKTAKTTIRKLRQEQKRIEEYGMEY